MASSLINIECKRYGCIKNLLACYANCRYNGRCDELRNEVADKLERVSSDINLYRKERGSAPVMVQLLKRGLKFVEPPTRQPGINRPPIAALPAKITPQVADPSEIAAKGPVRRLSHALKKRPVVARKAIEPRPPARAADAAEQKRSSAQGKPPERPARLTQRRAAADVKPKPKRRSRPKSRKPVRVAATPARPGGALKPAESIRPAARVEERKASSDNMTVMEKKMAEKKPAQRKNRSSNSAQSRQKGKHYIILEGKTATIVDEQGLLLHLLSGNSPDARYFEANEVEARLQIVQKR